MTRGLWIAVCFIVFGAAPALAWTFTPDPICTLSGGDDTRITVTYDPRARLYAIDITRPGGWAPAPVFALQFTGRVPLTITTDRHRIDGPRLRVTDRGFGNVLRGLENGGAAVAMLGDTRAAVALQGAAGPVQAFRACADPELAGMSGRPKTG